MGKIKENLLGKKHVTAIVIAGRMNLIYRVIETWTIIPGIIYYRKYEVNPDAQFDPIMERMTKG